MTKPTMTLHGGCIVLGEAGVLIIGASGSGKSGLARRLIEAARERGTYASLVSDDRTILSREAGRIIARPHPMIAGRMEVRGVGIVSMEAESSAVVRLLVDLAAATQPRLPEAPDSTMALLGLDIVRLALDSRASAGENAALVQFRLERLEWN